MKELNLIFLIVFIGILACSPQKHGEFKGDINIIPKPVDLVQSDGQLVLQEGLVVYAEKGHKEARKIAEMFASDFAAASGWKIDVQDLNDNQLPSENNVLFTTKGSSIDHQEGYTLNVDREGVKVQASEGAGLFYGMQTLKQLLPTAIFSSQPSDVAWELPYVTISDYPQFSWRGLHLDVGRHMSSVAFIKEYLDNMAMHKLNTFHWHLTEDQGWRIEIKRYPKLTEIGAYRDETVIGHARKRPEEYDGKRYGGFYTQEEVKEIVAYASDRYITVVPEIELPGHATAAIAAYPELGTTGKRPKVVTTWGIFPEIFNVEDETFEFLENVLTEVIALFPSQYIHIGGDEALKDQWENSEKVQAKIKELGLKDEHELQSWFITRIEKFVNSKGRQIIGWDEILEGGLAPNAAVMSWRGEEGGIAAARSKHYVVMSPTDYLYFDYHQGAPEFEPMAIGGLLTLEQVYSYDPTPDELSPDEQEYILGAQANVWTEYMPNEDRIEYMVFPRISALSEVVWSSEETRDWEDFKKRIPTHLERYDLMDINYAESIYFVNFNVVADSTEGFKVTLENQLALDGMRYTTDGSEPTIDSPLYTGPFGVENGTQIKARLFVDGEGKGKVTETLVGEVE